MLSIFKKKQPKKVFKIEDMHCASCAMVIEDELESSGIKANCSYAKQTLEVDDTPELDEARVKKIVSKAGYKLI